jgi:hypothetical protein
MKAIAARRKKMAPGDLGRAERVAGRSDDAGIGAERFRGLEPDLLK